ncbi:MAG: transcriptional regulator [bacterium]|nr:transcriptional regulator [bacterium]
MISKDEIQLLLNDLESHNIERTVSTTDTEKFCKAICAFANDMSGKGECGYLFVGADDKTGKIKDIEITDKLLQKLARLASYRDTGQIIPLPSITVTKESFPEGDLAVVEVRPSDIPPIRFKGRTWVRVGPRQGIANEQEERILTERSVHFAKTFDMRPCFGCEEEMIVYSLFYAYRNSALAPEIIEENNRDTLTQMAALGCWDLKNKCLTNVGALLFSESPQSWFPGATVQYVRFDGTGMDTGILDERKFSGDLLTLLRELDAFLKPLFPSRPVAVSSLREEQKTPYPNRAVRELLMNAVMHRDYESNAPIRFYWFSDRIEIQNPGGLYGAAKDFPHQNDYRNPKVAEAMKVLGYVNQFGRGIATVKSALEKNGNPPAEFNTASPQYFLAKVKESTS